MVLARSLSNPTWKPSSRVIADYRKLDLTKPAKKREPARATKRAKRLNIVEVERIKAAYIAGASSTELAMEFAVGKNTTCLKLRATGVSVRTNALTQDQMTTATSLYATGTSVARIAGQLGVDDKDAVRFALIRDGVQLRVSQGRPRRAAILNRE